jgi:hypothetical protein
MAYPWKIEVAAGRRVLGMTLQHHSEILRILG